jgi:hypothetical protein
VQGAGRRVYDLGLIGLRVQGLWFRVYGLSLGVRYYSSKFRVQGSWFRVKSPEFEV